MFSYIERAKSLFRTLAKGDICILCAILVAALLMFAGQAIAARSFLSGTNREAILEIRSPGRETRQISIDPAALADEGPWDIDGPAGGLVVAYVPGKGICVSKAACPDQVCVGMGYVRGDGESIVCVPNEIIILLRTGGEGGGDGLDAVLR
jgi:hypothetical protein